MKTKLILYSLISLILFACKIENPANNKIGKCPNIDDPISWQNGIVKYGDWQFGYTWKDGYYAIGTGGVVTTNLHHDCNCPYNGNEIGGLGNTYAVYLPSQNNIAVIFRWKNNTFCEMEVFESWEGKTEVSAQMHCLLNDFLHLYPSDFTVSTTDPTQYDAKYSNNVHVTAFFTQKEPNLGSLKKLKIWSE